MKLLHTKSKGGRILKCQKAWYHGKKHKRPYWIEPKDNLYFQIDTCEWNNNFDGHNAYYVMNHLGLKNFYSLKAVIRFLRKCKAPKGAKFSISGTYEGYDAIFTK